MSVVSGGTDVHLVLVDLRNSELDGQAAEDLLHEIGITVNRNAVPNDPRPPMVTSGLRVGTPALATRGFGDAEFSEVADVIATALAGGRGPIWRRCGTGSPGWPGISRCTRASKTGRWSAGSRPLGTKVTTLPAAARTISRTCVRKLQLSPWPKDLSLTR